MLADVFAWAAHRPTTKLVSKETLNHAGLIELTTGLDPYRHTPAAYLAAYQALGIDILNRVPLEPAPLPTPPGTSRPHPGGRPYNLAPLGVFDTAMRSSYPCSDPDAVYALDVAALRCDDLVTPVPHPPTPGDAQARQAAVGEVGLYYPMLYTTLFMWAVEVLGWEIFMTAASIDPVRFHDHFLAPCAAKSKAIVSALAGVPAAFECPFVFVHDDLASATGPVFRPSWYDRYIFPHYPEIWAEAKRRGKQVVFVADGNMTAFLPRLIDAGVDGIMFEAPATPLDAVIEHFGQAGRFFIGGISTRTLAFGTPKEVRCMVAGLVERAGACPGFALASSGGLHGDLPLANLEAYFDARVEVGATPRGWRELGRELGRRYLAALAAPGE